MVDYVAARAWTVKFVVFDIKSACAKNDRHHTLDHIIGFLWKEFIWHWANIISSFAAPKSFDYFALRVNFLKEYEALWLNYEIPRSLIVYARRTDQLKQLNLMSSYFTHDTISDLVGNEIHLHEISFSSSFFRSNGKLFNDLVMTEAQ